MMCHEAGGWLASEQVCSERLHPAVIVASVFQARSEVIGRHEYDEKQQTQLHRPSDRRRQADPPGEERGAQQRRRQ